MSTATDNTNAALDAERAETAQTIADKNAKIADLEQQVDDLTPDAPVQKNPLIGASQPDNVWGHKPESVRLFLSGGKTPTTMDLGDVPQGALLILSRKDRGAWFDTLLDNIRKGRPDLTLAPILGIHEPEDDVKRGELTVDQYKSWCNEDAKSLHAAGLKGYQILMGSSGKQNTWQQWLVDASDGLWFDVYMPAAGVVPKAYQDPAVFLKTYLDIQTKVGKPMGFPEFAFRPMADGNEKAYTTAMRQYRDYVRTLDPTKIVTASWYNSPNAPAEFTTQARADAWLL